MRLSKQDITQVFILPIAFLTTFIFSNHLLLRAEGLPSLYELTTPFSAGFYWYYVLSFVFGLIFTASSWMILKGGRKRLYGGIILFLSLSICCSYYAGVIIFENFFLSKPIDIWASFNLFYHPHYYSKFLLCQTLSISPLLIVIILYLFKHQMGEHPFGNAHFSNLIETDRAGFFTKNESSIILAKKGSMPVYSNGFEHVLCSAPSGSGKTTAFATPNLFHYPYSVVCNDVKLSLFKTTSGYRENQLGHKCFLWSLSDEDGVTHRYNPLDCISRDPVKCIRDIQRIAHIFIPDSTHKSADGFWSRSSRQLFMALVLYIIGTDPNSLTFGNIARISKKDDFLDWLNEEVEQNDLLHPEFYRNAGAFLREPEKTLGNALADFTKRFELFSDPYIDAATSTSDFDLRDLRKKKMTIYVGFNDDDTDRLKDILTLFWQQLISFMTQKLPDPNEEPYPLLCLIDEFSSLNRIDKLRNSLKLLREYRVRCVLMLQYFGQTLEKYSREEAKAFANIKTKLSFGVDDIDDAELISKILGTKTKRINAGSSSTQQNGMNTTRSYQYQGVPLMRPDEILRLKSPNALIMRTGTSPLKAKQYFWYKDRVMKKLKMPSVFIPTQKVSLEAFVKSPADSPL